MGDVMLIIIVALGLVSFAIIISYMAGSYASDSRKIMPWPVILVAGVCLFILVIVSIANIASKGAVFSPPPCPTYEKVDETLYRLK